MTHVRDAELSELALVVQRLAVLLGAGVAPSRAWRHAARGELRGSRAWRPASPRSRSCGSGRARGARRTGVVGACGRVVGLAVGGERDRARAEVVCGGAPRVRRRGAAGARGPGRSGRDVTDRARDAGGRILFGAALGYDSWRILVLTSVGWGCLAVGGVLVAAGWAWNRRLLARAMRGAGRIPGLTAELMSQAMSGGVSVSRARRIVGDACASCGVEADWRPVDEAVAVAEEAGAPVAELLRAGAEAARLEAEADAAERTERLGVALMLPLGLCVLPAFVAVGVVPLIAAIVSSTLEGL